jgi:hypothetical protein
LQPQKFDIATIVVTGSRTMTTPVPHENYGKVGEYPHMHIHGAPRGGCPANGYIIVTYHPGVPTNTGCYYTYSVDNYGFIFYSSNGGPAFVAQEGRPRPLSNRCIDAIKTLFQNPYVYTFCPNVQTLLSLCDELDATAAELDLVRPMLLARTEDLESRPSLDTSTALLKVQHCEEVARLLSRMEAMEKEIAYLKLCEAELSRLKQIDEDNRRAVAFEQRLLQQQRLETWKYSVPNDPE